MNKDQTFSLIRQGLTLIGGYLVIKGTVTEVDWSTLVGTLMTVTSIAWSMITHNKA